MKQKQLLNKEDVLKADFQVNVRGYDAEQVDSFLDKVALDYEFFAEVLKDYESRIQTLSKKNIELNTTVSNLTSSHKTISNELERYKKDGYENLSVQKKVGDIERTLSVLTEVVKKLQEKN
jgi:DivIVA domain-containing protein